MSTLNENSSWAEIRLAYRRNADYDSGNGDRTKAETFIKVCRWILASPVKAKKGGGGGAEDEYNLELVERQLQNAQEWLAQNDTSAPQVLEADFTGFDSRR